MPIYNSNCSLVPNVSRHNFEQNQAVYRLPALNVKSKLGCGQACIDFSDTLRNLTCNAFSLSKEKCHLYKTECLTKALSENISSDDEIYSCQGMSYITFGSYEIDEFDRK